MIRFYMKPFAIIMLALSGGAAFAQTSYWQQKLRYTIQAELNDTEKSITGNESIVYKNNSPDTLSFIWFHIWPNAYKHDSTALMAQIKKDPDLMEKETVLGKGWIEGLDFKVNDQKAITEPHPNPQYIDIIKVVLPNALLPGDSVMVSTPFKVFLPPYFSRSGYADGQFIACQWYPKPAVYDHNGWNEFPYLDMGEFYSEYGDYSVSLVVPSSYIVGATGTLLTKDEVDEYKKTGSKNFTKPGKKPAKKPALYKPKAGEKTKTLVYEAQNVPDFAWFADQDFVILYDTIRLNNRVVDAFSYYHNKKKTIWTSSMGYIKDAVRKYSSWVGEYEYPVVQVVEGPKNNSSGGMEYPMITLITSPDASGERLDIVITHEVGHNWFMSMLGSNERAHTWMDEGLNSYYEFRYEAEKYRGNSLFGNSIPDNIKKLSLDKFQSVIYNSIHESLPMQSAMDIPADQFPNSDEYGTASYIKTALWMYMLEAGIGRDKLDAAVHHYFEEWKHKHPEPADMKESFEESTGTDLDGFFELINKEGKF
jgi:hypothetical protein